jgi:Arc/MetJ family transcription regulator
MRTNVDIDDRLMQDAMRASGRKRKRAVIDAALRLLVQTKSQVGVRSLRGQIDWHGDLEESRSDRVTSSRGLTIRKTIDCVIATFCLVSGHALLHHDRDCDAFEGTLGLRVVHPCKGTRAE